MTVPILGVIEGFYGKSWSWNDRFSYVDFLANAGYQLFIYAPKSDACLRKSWEQDWGRDDFDKLLQLGQRLKNKGLKWGVGLSPFEVYTDYSGTVKQRLQAKLKRLNDLQLDVLCVLFDDMSGTKANMALRQAEIVADIQIWSNAAQCIVCPSYYSFDPILDHVFGHRPEGYLEALGQNLAPEVGVFWTGNKVISPSISCDDMLHAESLLGRKAWLWDNYPVNDGKQSCQFLHLKGFDGRDATLGKSIVAHIANPMNQPWLSKIPILSLPELYKSDDYSPESATLRALKKLCPPKVVTALTEDLACFQNIGFEKIGMDKKTELIEKYQAFDDNFSAEVLAWLQEYYKFDPVCLTQ